MHRKGVFIFLAAILWLGIGIKAAPAQSDTPRYEVSGVVTTIRQDGDFYRLLPRFFGEPSQKDQNFGFGGRLTLNINRAFAVEGELTHHPQSRSVITDGVFSPPVIGISTGGMRLEGLFGVKVGKRFKKFGIFGKVRPGFMRLSEVPDCPRGDIRRCSDGGKFEPALDIGGAVEYYPTRRFVIRFDAGDTIIRYGTLRRGHFVPTPPFFESRTFGGNVTHNAQFSLGFGVRF